MTGPADLHIDRDQVVLAHGLLLLQAAKNRGVIDGGPDILVDECERWVTIGEERCLEISDTEIVQTAKALLEEMSER